MYGRLTDLELYLALLNQHFDLFIELAEELADSFIRDQIEYVVGDAAEGYSPAHDVCRLLIDAAVTLTRLKHKRHVSNFDFLVVAPPDEDPDTGVDEAIRIRLDDNMFSRKVAASHDYSPKLAADIDAALRGEKFQGVNRLFEPQIAGRVDVEAVQTILTALKSRSELEAQFKELLGGVELDAFRTECLRPVAADDPAPDLNEVPPFYEIYGEKLVAAGRYEQVIRYREHIRPLAGALRDHVTRNV
jgi:hypothetical protein